MAKLPKNTPLSKLRKRENHIPATNPEVTSEGVFLRFQVFSGTAKRKF